MPTKVTFRKVYDGEIVAVFASLWSRRGYELACYAHIGQHGPIDYEFYLDCTKPANPSEYSDLLAELRAVGYDDLRICKRLNISKIFRSRFED